MTTSLKHYGSDFEAGDLVAFSYRDYLGKVIEKHGVVMDYYRSNVYEPSTYQVLVEGEPLYVQSSKVRPWNLD